MCGRIPPSSMPVRAVATIGRAASRCLMTWNFRVRLLFIARLYHQGKVHLVTSCIICFGCKEPRSRPVCHIACSGMYKHHHLLLKAAITPSMHHCKHQFCQACDCILQFACIAPQARSLKEQACCRHCAKRACLHLSHEPVPEGWSVAEGYADIQKNGGS